MNSMAIPKIDVDVIIIGGGVAGLTMACDVARRGVRIRIVEKSMTPFQGSGGMRVQARSMEVFDDLGIARPLRQAGAKPPPMRVHVVASDLRHASLQWDQTPPDAPHPTDLLVPQWRTEHALRQRLSELGRQVEFGSEVLNIEQDHEGVTVRVQCRGVAQSIRSRYVVCADGGQNPARTSHGVELGGPTNPQARMIVGDVRAAGLDRDAWHVWPTQQKGWVGLCPLPHSDLFQLVMLLDESEPAPALSEPALQARWVAATGLKDIQLHGSGWLTIVRVPEGKPERFRMGRLFYVGGADLAQAHGGSLDCHQGVQDAYSLGWRLALVLHGSPEMLLDTHEAERRAAKADALTWPAMPSQLPTGSLHAGLNQGGAQLHVSPSFTEGVLRVAPPETRPGRWRPGDRAPDATCARHQTGQATLFDEFRGGHFNFTVLVFGADAIKALGACRWRDPMGYPAMVRLVAVHTKHLTDDANALVDEGHHARSAYGVADDENMAFLIRPDGNIGLIAHDDWARLISLYLERMAGFSLREEAAPKRANSCLATTGVSAPNPF